MRGRRRWPADVVGVGVGTSDGPPSVRAGRFDVPGFLAGLRAATGSMEPEFLSLLSHRHGTRLVVAAAADHPDHGAAGSAHARDDGGGGPLLGERFAAGLANPAARLDLGGGRPRDPRLFAPAGASARD